MVKNGDRRVERIASNAWLMVIGRAAMICVVPIMSYVGIGLIELKADVRVMQAAIDTQKALIESQMMDRYRGADALRDQRLLQIQVDDAKRRLDALERGRPLPR